MISINQRVSTLENGHAELSKRLDHLDGTISVVSKNTTEILQTIKTAKIAGGWLSRIGRHVLTAAVTAGFFTGKITAFLSAILA